MENNTKTKKQKNIIDYLYNRIEELESRIVNLENLIKFGE